MRRGTLGAIKMGETLRDIRIEAGLNMAEVARRIGSPTATVSQIEKGQRALKEPKIALWAVALGVASSDLRAAWVVYNRMSELEPLTRNRGSSISVQGLEALICSLSTTERDRVLGYVHGIIESRKD